MAETSPGRGTTMTISLPGGTTGPVPAGEPGRILYVDDNPSSLRLVEKILARHPGVRLHLAATGSDGLAAATEELPDLVLLDVDLPDVPGQDVIRSLRSDPRTSSIPVVVVTAEHDSSVADALLALGAAEVVTKPLDPRLLADIVTTYLQDKAVHP